MIFLNSLLLSQYVGIACSYNDRNAQVFNMDSLGNIVLKEIINLNNTPIEMETTISGLILIVSYGYSPPTAMTLSVLKIEQDGSVKYVRDIDLGGGGLDVCITRDNKYVLIRHYYDQPNQEYDYGISVLRLIQNDVLMPPIQFLSMADLGIVSTNIDVNQDGVVLGVTRTPLEIFDISNEGYLSYTNNNIELDSFPTHEMEFSPDGRRCYLSRLGYDLWVFDVDESKNVSLWGYIETPEVNARDLAITPDSKLILETMNSGTVNIYKNKEDGTVIYKDKISYPSGTGAMTMTLDGKYSVVAYGYTITKTNLSVLKINPDETIIRLPDKDVTVAPGIECMAIYQLPPTLVETNWQMYK